MAFSKFDPYRPEEGHPDDPVNETAARRIWLLKWGWRITMVYTAMGFGFIVYWMLK